MEQKQPAKMKEKASSAPPSFSTEGSALLQLAGKVPWELIAPFLDLSDVLKLRAMSKEVLTRLHEGTSREQCAIWLGKALQKGNLYMMDSTSRWQDATNEPSDQLVACLKNEAILPFDSLLLCMRVIKYVPTEMAVCYSGKYGRHCLPWSRDTEGPDLRIGQFLYSSCSRGKQNCETCRFRIPIKEAEDEEHIQEGYRLGDFLQIRDSRRGGLVDLQHCYNKCIPNLPPDLICPVCRVSDRRTLVLSDMSYQSEAGTEKPEAVRMSLTFTPRHAAVEESAAKRAKIDDEDRSIEEASFPPKYREMFIPEMSLFPLEHTPDCKHCISIHCSSCRSFGVIAPAGLCAQRQFNCPERGGTVIFSRSYIISVGGVLRRTKCSEPDCNNPAFCSTCSYGNNDSDNYEGEMVNEFDHCLMCDKCKRLYCWEHDGSHCCRSKGDGINSGVRSGTDSNEANSGSEEETEWF